MDIWTILNPVLGGLTGAVGAIGGKVVDMLAKKQENEHALKMAEVTNAHALALADKQASAQAAIDAAALFKASFDNDSAKYGDSVIGKVVDGARGIIRPLITVAGGLLIGWLTFRAVKAGLPPDLQTEVVQTGLFVSSTAVTWWFGTRFSRR